MQKKKKKVFENVPTYIILVVAALFTLIPLYLIFITSFKDMTEIVQKGPVAFPQQFRWENYVKVWQTGNFPTYFKNSIIVTLLTDIGVLTFSLLGSYAFSYLEFKGKNFLFTLIQLGLMIPAMLIILPLFYDLKALKILNTRWALVLPLIALIIPFSVFVLRGFMKSIPKALLESARIDGSTEFQNLIYIIVPLVKPALVSVVVFSTIWSWNNFTLPTVLVQDDMLRTLPVGLNYFRGKFIMDYSMVAAAATMTSIPTITLFLILRRRFIKGMMIGALKE